MYIAVHYFAIGQLSSFLSEIANALKLASRRILPCKLFESGYQFQFAELKSALHHELGMGDIQYAKSRSS
jgi:NAD dependent epimerase/dehydratase family enzyme